MMTTTITKLNLAEIMRERLVKAFDEPAKNKNEKSYNSAPEKPDFETPFRKWTVTLFHS